jgi:transposase
LVLTITQLRQERGSSRDDHRAIARAAHRPARRPLPPPLPRQRIVDPAASVCPCCGGGTVHKIGEDLTETLWLIPRQRKVIQHVREKFSCRSPRDDHATAGAFASDPRAGAPGRSCSPMRCSPNMAWHLPLNRQSAVYAREGNDLDVSTLAD